MLNELSFSIKNLFTYHLKKNLKCDPINLYPNSYFVGGYCSNNVGSACAINCKSGYKLYGSNFRQCLIMKKSTYPSWSGRDTFCESRFKFDLYYFQQF